MFFRTPEVAIAAANEPASIRARHPSARNPKKPDGEPLTYREAGEQKMHAFLDKIDDVVNYTPKPKTAVAKPGQSPKETGPVVVYEPVHIPYQTYLANADVVLSLVCLAVVTLLLVFTSSHARVADLVVLSVESINGRIARERHELLPRMLSADILLILLAGMSVNAFVLAILRVVEAEHKKELEKTFLEEITAGNDIDVAVNAAYEEADERRRKDRAEKRAALSAENEKRKKEGKIAKRHRVYIRGIVTVESVTDAIVPVTVFFPIILGTIVVLQGANPVRGFGVILMFLQMVVGAVLAKLVDSTRAVAVVFNVMQSLNLLVLMVMIGLQWYNE